MTKISQPTVQHEIPKSRWPFRVLRGAGICTLYLIGVAALLWAVGAVWYDLPGPSAVRHLLAVVLFVTVVCLWMLKKRTLRAVAIVLVAMVALSWQTLKPANARQWQPDVAQVASAEFAGDEVTLHNVRNFDYRTETDFTPRWETRKVRISQITGIDLAVNYWGSPFMAHPIISFQFADAPPLCFSIETRKEVGESYSAIGGFYRQYELIYVVADERDVIRVRTNYRKGEDVYLYRMTTSKEKAQRRFVEYLVALNALKDHPRWYHAATANCTTTIRTQREVKQRAPWDWRFLVNGWADQMLYERGSLVSHGLDFHKLKAASQINLDAKAADDAPDFSQRIRQHAPSFAGAER